MREYLIAIIPWVLSALGIYAAWQLGNKKAWIFKLKIFNQGLWITWICASESWGFMPMALVFVVLYFRNHLKWRKGNSADSATNP